MKVTWKEVEDHVNKVNAGHRGTPRDFWGAAPFGLGKLSWSLEPVLIEKLPEGEPFSQRDVRRYAAFAKKHKSDFPPIIVLVTFDVEVLDGPTGLRPRRRLETIGSWLTSEETTLVLRVPGMAALVTLAMKGRG